MHKIIGITLSLNLLPALAMGSDWELFDDAGIPAGWSASPGSTLAAEESVVLQGNGSLAWEWTTPAPIIEYTGTPWDSTGHVNAFSFWVHRETPLEGAVLKVSFLNDDTLIRSFEFGLAFQGWRTGFIPYARMTGSQLSQINTLRLEVVGESVPESGRILIDQVVFTKIMDSRHTYPDVQAPFVKDVSEDHWAPLVEELGRDPLTKFTPTEEELAAGSDLATAIHAELAGTGHVSTTTVDNAEVNMGNFGLERTPEGVRGYHIFYNSYPGMAFPTALRNQINSDGKKHDLREYGSLQLQIAQYYHRTDDPTLKTRLADMFTLMAEHLLNQGWAAGSNQGCIHHIGYQIREYYEAHFLMRDVLADAGLLERSQGAVQWYTRAGRLLSTFIEPNLDDFNTAIKGQLLGLLMEDDPTLRAAWLKAYQDGQSKALATVMPGDGLGFKPDGTAFHHNGHYPAYATGAFSSLGFLFDHLRNTPFQFSVPAQAAFRNALLTSRIYSQKFDWPIGICGRHPFSGSISGQQRAFKALSAYPDPVTGITPDPDMSAALVRLWGNPGGELGEAINNAGIVPDYIDGFHSLPFANQAIARGPGWMVSMKGYSKYVWSSEIYSADNRYGRYQSNGSVEVLMENGRAASGFEQEGWDWNRLPGTTGIHLPLEELESPRSGSLLLRSNETFAGDANLNNRTGIFGFILNEPFFGNDLKARKSVCMLGDVLVALGSGISSSNTTYATETTIFQTALPSVDTPQYFGNGVGAKTGIDVSGSLPSGNGLWILDPVGTGYWLAPKQLLRWHRKTQDSFHNKTKQATSGDFSSVWIGHRTSPTNAKYHYAILPMATQEELEDFNQSMQSEETARYAVLSQTENLHAVYDNANSTLYVASFEAAENLNLPLLLATSEPMLVVVQEDGSGLNVAASNPDLKPTASGHTISTNNLLLTGHWMPAPSDACMYWHENGNTRVVLPTQAGETNEVSLVPATEILPFSDIPKSTEITPVTLVRTSPSTTEVSWVAEASPDRIGWIIEKLDSESGGYQPVVLLSSGARSWSDLQVGTNELVAYRITEWTTDSLGPPSLPVPLFQKEGFELTYDFREISSLDGFYSDGWIATDVTDAELYLDTLGLMLIDQSPTAPAAITLPFIQKAAGSVEATLGVNLIANYFLNMALLHDDTVLMAIELYTRTDGFIETSTSTVNFTDVSWHIDHNDRRRVTLAWQQTSESEFSIDGTFYPLAGTPLTTHTEAFNADQLPNKIRIKVGYESAVNRGGLIETFSLSTTDLEPTIPISALPGSYGGNLISTENNSLALRFDNGQAPIDYGLQLLGESSFDLRTWAPFTPELFPLLEGSGVDYLLPDLESDAQFYRFEMAP